MKTTVIGASAMNFLNRADASEKQPQSNGTSFDSVLGNSVNSTRGTQTSTRDSRDVGKPDAGRDTAAAEGGIQSQEEADAGKNTIGAGEEKKANEGKGTEETVRPEEGSKTEGQETVSQETLKGIGSQIMDMVKEVLDMSDEDLNKLMAELGMVPMDFLQMDQLKNFIVTAKGNGDITEFLTNENFSDSLNQLTESLNHFVLPDGRELTKEELKNLLDAASRKGADTVQQPFLVQTDAGALKEAENKVQPESQLGAVSQEKEAVPIVVEKEEAGNSAMDTENREKPFFRKEMEKEPELPALESFIKNLSDAKLNGSSLEKMEPAQVMREIVNQIVEQIKVTIKPQATSMEMMLNPEELGKVHLTVAASKSGEMTAAFTVQNEAAKEAIEGQLQILRESLDKQGIKVDAVEVTVSNFGFEQSNSQQQQSGEKKKAPRRIDLSDMGYTGEELSPEDTLAAEIMEQNGNRVDYTA